MALILQPAGSADASEHYNDTIENPVKLSDPTIRDLLGPTLGILESIFAGGEAPMWGIVPSKLNSGKYARMREGDRVVFSRNKRIYSTGIVAHKFENYELSRHLWDSDENGATWSLMYALDEVEDLDIPYIDFNRAVGYAENNIIQGFNILDEEKSLRFENVFFSEHEVNETPPGATRSWGQVFPNVWLIYTLEGRPNPQGNVGNLGYEDLPGEVYRYDSLVPNWKQLSVGDIILLRSEKYLLGMAKIERIDEIQGDKQLNRCPDCNKTSIKERRGKRPKYRCQKCGEEFDEPKVDFKPVTIFSAWYKDSYFPCFDAIPISLLRKACISERSQLSMQKMVMERLTPLLMRIAPSIAQPPSPTPSKRRTRKRGNSEEETPRKGKPWTAEADRELWEGRNTPTHELAAQFSRGVGGIRSRLEHLANPEHAAYQRLNAPSSSQTHPPRKVRLTEEMIPRSSEDPGVVQEVEKRIRVLVDGKEGNCFISDPGWSSEKIVIFFDKEHERWHDCFSTKHFIFEEPGKMAFGDGESMEIFRLVTV